jgi:hypothetical protein
VQGWPSIRLEHDPESGNRFSLATSAKRLRRDHAQTKRRDHDPIQSNRIMI